MNYKRFVQMNGSESNVVSAAGTAYFLTVLIVLSLLPVIGGVCGLLNLYEFSVYSYKTMITLGLLFIYLFIALITYFIAADVENGILSSLIIIGIVGLGIGVYSLFHYGIIPICAITLLIVGVIDVAVAVFMFVLGK